MFVIFYYFGFNLFGKLEFFYILYMDIQIYIKYNDFYRFYVLGKVVGVCVKNFILYIVGEVYCVNYMYGE